MSEPQIVDGKVNGRKVIWQPTAGSQTLALSCPANLILYHGSRGNGKTDLQIMRFRKSVGIGYGRFWKGIIIDRQYSALDDIITKTKRYFPQFLDGAKFLSSKGEFKWVWKDGEELLFRAVADEQDYQKLHGQEFCYIGINELSQYADSTVLDLVTSLNRTSFVPQEHPLPDGTILPEIPLTIFCTTNPSGRGHLFVKKRFIDAGEAGEIVKREVNIFNPRTQKEEVMVKTQCHIFGSYRENTKLSPEYVADLESIIDPRKRRAWLLGSWDNAVDGGMFEDVWDSDVHVISPFDIPNGWKIDRSFDWGSSSPFSVNWWAESNGEDIMLKNGKTRSTMRGDLFLIGEYYGCEEGNVNKGLKMLAHDVATEIVKRELMMGIHDRCKGGAADNSIWNMENGNSIARSMNQPIVIGDKVYQGVTWERSDKSRGSRVHGWEAVKQFLQNAKTTPDKPYREKAGLFVFNTNKYFIEIFPTTVRDTKNPDDVETHSCDHIQDSVRYRVLATKLGSKSGKTKGLT